MVVGSLLPLASCVLLTDLDGLDSASASTSDAAGAGDGPTSNEAGASPLLDAAGEGDGNAGLSYAAAVMADGPITYLRFEEATGSIANDSSGKGNVAIVSGSFEWGKQGVSDKALGLDQAAIDFGAKLGDFIDKAPFTLEVWANVNTADTAFRHLWTKNFAPNSAPRHAYGVYVRENILAFERVVNDTFRVIETSYVDHMNRWTHVVATYDGQSIALYLDAQLIERRTDGRSIPSIATTNLFAGTKEPNYGWTRGLMDEVAVYDKALTADRVKVHFDLGAKR